MASHLVDWLEELRAPFFTASIVPVLLGSAVVLYEGRGLDPLLMVLTLVGVVLLHAGTNIANDYYDHTERTDDVNVGYVRPFTGGSRKIQEGRLEARAVHRAALALIAAGAVFGVVLFLLTRGPLILLFGVIGIFSGYMYSAPPLRLSSRGLGELTVGLNFGLLIVLGTYYVQTLALSWTALAVGIPMAFLITAVLHVNQFPDVKADGETGKATLVVRLGTARAVITQYMLIAGASLSIVVSVALRILPIWTLLGLMPLPLAVRSLYFLRAGTAAGTGKKAKAALAEACGTTVRCHLATGLLLVAGLLLSAGFG